MARARRARAHRAARDVRFTRRDVREATHWSDNQLKVHCARLADMEYLLVHGGARGHSLSYELLWDGRRRRRARAPVRPDRPGRAAATEAHGYDGRKLGYGLASWVPSWPQVGPKLGSSWSLARSAASPRQCWHCGRCER